MYLKRYKRFAQNIREKKTVILYNFEFLSFCNLLIVLPNWILRERICDFWAGLATEYLRLCYYCRSCAWLWLGLSLIHIKLSIRVYNEEHNAKSEIQPYTLLGRLKHKPHFFSGKKVQLIWVVLPVLFWRKRALIFFFPPSLFQGQN